MKTLDNMKGLLLVLLLFVLSSCFLISKHRKSAFSYVDESGTNRSINIIIPKGYKNRQIRTINGIQEHVYHYSDSTWLFFAYMPKGGNYLPIDTHYHIVQPQLYGGQFYKGTGIGEFWWREAQIKNLRAGYNKVPKDLEWRFDSAINYIRLQ